MLKNIVMKAVTGHPFVKSVVVMDAMKLSNLVQQLPLLRFQLPLWKYSHYSNLFLVVIKLIIFVLKFIAFVSIQLILISYIRPKNHCNFLFSIKNILSKLKICCFLSLFVHLTTVQCIEWEKSGFSFKFSQNIQIHPIINFNV